MEEHMYRNIFIDTESNTFGSGEQSKIIFPAIPFSTMSSDEIMKLTLTTFEMRRNWYNINQTNNKFYLYDPAGPTFSEITIAPGNYITYIGLATAIQTAVATLLVGSTCVWLPIERKFQIVLSGAPAGSYLVCFQANQASGTPPAGVSTQGGFSDSFEILGGVVNKTFANPPLPAFVEAPAGTFKSTYLGQLNSLEAIYLRTSIPSNNYQTFGFEQDLQNQKSGMTPTSILARIPLNTTNTVDGDELITFEDPNGLFSMLVEQSQLNQIILSVTDDKNREIPQVSQGQFLNGSLNFKCSLKWSLVKKPSPLAHKILRMDDIPKRYLSINP